MLSRFICAPLLIVDPAESFVIADDIAAETMR
jgi:hypothetical protein